MQASIGGSQLSNNNSGKKMWLALITGLLINVALTPILILHGVNVFWIYALVLWFSQTFIYFAVPKPYLSKIYWLTLYLLGCNAILGTQSYVVRAVSKHPDIVSQPIEFSLRISQVRASLFMFFIILFIAILCVVSSRKDRVNLFLVMNALGAVALWECANSMITPVVSIEQIVIIYHSMLCFNISIVLGVLICCLLVISRWVFSLFAKTKGLHNIS